MRPPLRALFVNSGILGHATVARLLRDAADAVPGLNATHVDLAQARLTAGDRIVRRLMCARPLAALGLGGSNLDLGRWRTEMHAGVQAAREIARRQERQGAFDVLHFHTQATAYASLGRMRATPSVVSIDITQRLASLEAATALERATYAPNAARDRAVFRAARAIVATSQWAADDLASDVPECAGRVHVMPYPVPLERFPAGWAADRQARAGTGAVRVLFVGGDFPRKGGPDLLRAWGDAGLAGDAELVLVTDWPVDEAGLPPGVTLRRGITAYTAEWTEMWESADVFAMPTRGEAFGMVFQEAAAAGVPAVGTRLNAVPEIVADGETGFLVPPGDVAALAGALRTLVASAELRRAMGSAARARMERIASPERYAERLGGLLFAAADVAGEPAHV